MPKMIHRSKEQRAMDNETEKMASLFLVELVPEIVALGRKYKVSPLTITKKQIDTMWEREGFLQASPKVVAAIAAFQWALNTSDSIRSRFTGI